MRGLRAVASSLVLLLALTANAHEPNPRGLWMKDTAQDTGLEPDPATTSQDMWKSPYIWVRNAPDGLDPLNEFQHQNPEYGQDNYIYVKLLRELPGGNEPIDGEVVVYYANASTGLSWPGQWHEVGRVPVSLLGTDSERIAEIHWPKDKLPGTGHFCLLARYLSPDDEPHGETSNIDFNTRLNNNIIWRNLNVVDLVANREATTRLIVRNVARDFGLVDLAFRLPRSREARPFVREQGRVFIRLGEELFRRWQATGEKADGLVRVDEQVLEVVNPEQAVVFGLPMALEEAFEVELVFQRHEQVAPGVFHFDAVQLGRDGQETGGVGYEIRTIHAAQ